MASATEATSKSQYEDNQKMSSPDESDPFEIRHEIEKAPRPRPGHKSNIVEFYRGRSVLITGASGFIGKVLIEKLLRACPEIERVFVLIRPKYNKQPHERLRELLNARLFDGGSLRSEAERKVIVVQGDVTQPNLGMSQYDLARVVREVTVIFHSAATVKFDEPLKQSVAINITGTKNIIELCRRIGSRRLAALVHVSTAYANCDRAEVEEHIYPVQTDPERLLEAADWLDQDTLQLLKQRLLGAKPNTYTYTKSLAEWLLVRIARDLPVVICRPSIVAATASEPFAGWIDNMNGPTGVVLGAGKGLVRSMYAENGFVADLVPADKVINLIVSLGWFAHLQARCEQQQQLTGGQTRLEESLSDLVSSPSSVCCSSSSAGSSAASTSGVDDSMSQEDAGDLLRSTDENHLPQADDVRHTCSSLVSASQCNKDQCSHNHAHHLYDACRSSTHEEEECADLSIESESSSGRSSHLFEPSDLQSATGDRHLAVLTKTSSNDTESDLYSTHKSQRNQSNNTSDAPRIRRRQRQLQQQRHDDGYASSRSPRYANSAASSECASSLSPERLARCLDEDKTSSAATGKISLADEADDGPAATKLRSLSENDAGSLGNEFCESDLQCECECECEYECNNLIVRHMERRRQHTTTTTTTTTTTATTTTENHLRDDDVVSEVQCPEGLAGKFRKFKAHNLTKLNEAGLPDELADISVFHCTSGAENPITWGQVQVFILAALAVFPLSGAYRYPCGSFTNNEKLDKFYSLTLHYLPAYLVDFLVKVVSNTWWGLKGIRPQGKTISLVKIFQKFDQAASVLKAFTSKQWRFACDNKLFLMEELMNDEDRRLFDCGIKSLDWNKYCLEYVIGVRKFLLHEPMSNLEAARRNLRLVYTRNLCLQLASLAVGAYWAASLCGLHVSW